jgi:hypothetical protein
MSPNSGFVMQTNEAIAVSSLKGVPAVATRLASAGLAALILVALVAMAARFWRLDVAPPGFYADEAAVSAHVLCLKGEGHNLFGQQWPVISRVLGRGFSSVAWQAPAVVWSQLTGDSIAAMRSFAALCGVLLVAGVFFLALWSTGSLSTAAFSASALAISPWAFQFSRIAWDPAIAPVYLAWGLAFLVRYLRDDQDRQFVRWSSLVVSALLLALAVLSYPSLRPQAALVLLYVAWWRRAELRRRWMEAAAFTTLLILFSTPVWFGTITGELGARFGYLSVFSESLWAQRGFDGIVTLPLGLILFARNLAVHFSPEYLVISGDQNLRHSTQSFGEWSWLDAVAIAGFLAVTVLRRRRWDHWTWFLVIGYVSGLVPAALTWESPHASRSIGALPFLALFVGTALERLSSESGTRKAWVTGGAVVVALLFTAFFARDFWWRYPERAAADFDRRIVEWVDRNGPGSIGEIAPTYSVAARRYYEVRAGAPCLTIAAGNE